MNEIETTLELKPVEEGVYDRRQLEELADKDMAVFSQFFTEQLGNSAPTDYENFFLKTYVLFKLGAKMTK